MAEKHRKHTLGFYRRFFQGFGPGINLMRMPAAKTHSIFSAVCLFLLFFLNRTLAAEKSWRQISDLSVSEIASHFQSPPPEYGLSLWWGWNGDITKEVITRDLDAFYSCGIRMVTIEAGYQMSSPYLSDGWFKTIKLAVEQARCRGMRVWLVDEGKYPSGFAGGKFSDERPDLRMQGLVVAERIEPAAGETLTRALSPDIVSAIAVNLTDNTNQILDVHTGRLEWKVPKGQWRILLVEHQFRTSNTRSVNNPPEVKDTRDSLCDYLNPKATKQFLAFTHEQYKKYVGDEFGKTILGFRGDEPDYAYTPWTPAIADEFKRRKGYDVRPYLASFFAPHLTDEIRRVRADYWDVWSDLFSENFFRVQADWCAKHNLDYMVHLNHEDNMPELVRSEGDFFQMYALCADTRHRHHLESDMAGQYR